MSNEIIHMAEVTSRIAMLGIIVLLIFFGIDIISSLMEVYYSKKIKKHSEEAQKLENKCREISSYIPRELETEITDQDDEVLKSQKELLNQINQEKDMRDKYRNKNDNLDNWTHNSSIACLVTWVILLIFVIIRSCCSGGSVHNINKVTDVRNNDVVVTAYYNVTYASVEQETLTIFVKNESNKPLYKATIVEKNTGASTTIENLDLGQEKITSMVVYPTDDGNYEFEINDIEYFK